MEKFTKSMSEFQASVHQWVLKCFGQEIAQDKKERVFRFVEEALELAQSCDASKEEVLKLVDYVYGRPKGESFQEAGGAFLTLFALCQTHSIHSGSACVSELDRVLDKIEQIREKRNAKKIKSDPLP